MSPEYNLEQGGASSKPGPQREESTPLRRRGQNVLRRRDDSYKYSREKVRQRKRGGVEAGDIRRGELKRNSCKRKRKRRETAKSRARVYSGAMAFQEEKGHFFGFLGGGRNLGMRKDDEA